MINIKNPLDHLALAEQVQINVYGDVIIDEYCAAYDAERSWGLHEEGTYSRDRAFIWSADTGGIMYQPKDIQTRGRIDKKK